MSNPAVNSELTQHCSSSQSQCCHLHCHVFVNQNQKTSQHFSTVILTWHPQLQKTRHCRCVRCVVYCDHTVTLTQQLMTHWYCCSVGHHWVKMTLMILYVYWQCRRHHHQAAETAVHVNWWLAAALHLHIILSCHITQHIQHIPFGWLLKGTLHSKLTLGFFSWPKSTYYCDVSLKNCTFVKLELRV